MKIILKIIYEFWRIFPFSFIIGLITRITLVGVSISYLSSIGSESQFLTTIMYLWALTPFYYSIRNTYYEYIHSPCTGKGCLICAWGRASNKLKRFVLGKFPRRKK